jgi:putative phosphoesterase
MTRIGLISDTHSYLDPKVAEHFADCDEIWHAGDIGEMEVITQLEKIKPVRAVFGNIDDKTMQAKFPEDLWMAAEGFTILITHIAGSPPNYNPRVKKILKTKTPDILICGHSHILKIMKDKERNLFFINPGAAGQQGFHSMKTIVRFELHQKEIKKMEVIELGKRGKVEGFP